MAGYGWTASRVVKVAPQAPGPSLGFKTTSGERGKLVGIASSSRQVHANAGGYAVHTTPDTHSFAVRSRTSRTAMENKRELSKKCSKACRNGTSSSLQCKLSPRFGRLNQNCALPL